MGRGHTSVGISQPWAELVERSGRESPIRHRRFSGPHMDDPGPSLLLHPWRVERSGRESPIRHRRFAGPHMNDPGPVLLLHPWGVEWYET